MHSMPPRGLDWDDLRVFLAALDAGSLAGAARELRVEHTTVGRRLSALEDALGAPLVVRGPAGLVPTRLGEKLRPAAAEVARAVAALRELAATERAIVRLAVPSGMTALFTSRLAQLDAPLALEIVSGARPVDLSRGEADLALRVGRPTDPELVVRKLGRSGWALYAAPAYLARRGSPRDLADLSGHDVIGFDRALANVPAARWLEARSARANVVLRSREMTDMVAAARSGVGLAVLSCLLGDAEPALRRLTPEPVAVADLVLAYRRESASSGPVRAAIRFVSAVITDALS
jgi:DNA-binding transcriptional LysR family regulator